MHEHRAAETVGRDHPLLKTLARFLRTVDIGKVAKSFLVERVSFVYPKTIWIELSSAGLDDAKFRTEVDPLRTGLALNAWLLKSAIFTTVTFDLSDGPIDDILWIDQFITTVRRGMRNNFILCESDYVRSFGLKCINEASGILPNRGKLSELMRSHLDLDQTLITLPENLSFECLDDGMKRFGQKIALRRNEIMSLDLTKVRTFEFDAISMMPAIIHSAAHKYGVLSKVFPPDQKSLGSIREYDVFRVIKSYLVNGNISYELPRLPPPPIGMKMMAFTRAELSELKDQIKLEFPKLIDVYKEWFYGMAGIEYTENVYQKKLEVFAPFWSLIRELLDNAAMHSGGVGYFMMNFNQEDGFRLYFGDTGIGLHRGLNKSFKDERFTAQRAVRLALNLIELQEKRRERRGGRGLERVSLMLKQLKGTIRFRTGKVSASFGPSDHDRVPEVRTDLYEIQGTHIHVHIPPRKAIIAR